MLRITFRTCFAVVCWSVNSGGSGVGGVGGADVVGDEAGGDGGDCGDGGDGGGVGCRRGSWCWIALFVLAPMVM